MITTAPSQEQSGHAVSRRLARFLTEILAPTPVGVVAVTLVAWRYAPSLTDAIRWAAFSVALVALLPFAYLVVQVLRRRVTDIHVREREQRGPIILAFLASWTVAVIALHLLGAPRQLVALIATGEAALLVCGVITRWWKISLHVGVIAGVLTVFAMMLGRYVLLFTPLVPLVAWARVTVGDHTPRQVTAGALVGAAVSGIAFAAARKLLW